MYLKSMPFGRNLTPVPPNIGLGAFSEMVLDPPRVAPEKCPFCEVLCRFAQSCVMQDTYVRGAKSEMENLIDTTVLLLIKQTLFLLRSVFCAEA